MLLKINRYTPNKTSTDNTTTKYFAVSAFVGQTTCLISLSEAFIKLIIKNASKNLNYNTGSII